MKRAASERRLEQHPPGESGGPHILSSPPFSSRIGGPLVQPVASAFGVVWGRG